MVFGTFDAIHPGHENFFHQARALTKPRPSYLIVSVARDKNVQRIKGRLPRRGERQRLAALKKHPFVDQVVLGALTNYLGHIIKYRPDIIALGYDQKAYVRGLKAALAQRGLTPRIVRLKAFQPGVYKSSLLNNF